MRRRYDWKAVQRYLDEGHDVADCRQRFNISYGAWNMAFVRGSIHPGSQKRDMRRRFDWAQVQGYYDAGHSFYQCMRRFGFCRAAWQKARNRGEIVVRSPRRSLEELLRNGKSRRNIKVRLLSEGLLENRCQECGLERWMGEPLTIQIDHVNGRKADHRIENLRMLCPNCHSQTETYGSKNRGLHERGPAV